MAKRLPDPYYPTNPPVEFKSWHRWIVDELYRIRNSIFANVVAVAVVGGPEPIDISPAPVFEVIGIGGIPDSSFPEGMFDSATGHFTIPQDGLYMAIADVVIAPFGTGNKSYFGTVRVVADGVILTDGIDSGLDDVPVGISLATPINVLAGSEVWFEVAAEHELFTGVGSYDWRLSLYRISG